MVRFAYLAIAMTLLVAGCATQPVSDAEAVFVPSSRYLTHQFIHPRQGAGPLLVKRDRGIMGAACDIRVYLDGVPAVDLATSEKALLYVPVGEHVLGAVATGICAGGTAEASVVVTADRTRSFRVGSGQSGDLAIRPTAF